MKALPYIAAALLLVAVAAHMPYGFYQLLRWAVCIVAGIMAYNLTGWQRAVMIGVAVLFNPIAPIHFDRSTWQALDLVAGGVVLCLAKPATAR